jgi:3-methyladenine DNA glycosylase Mpg
MSHTPGHSTSEQTGVQHRAFHRTDLPERSRGRRAVLFEPKAAIYTYVFSLVKQCFDFTGKSTFVKTSILLKGTLLTNKKLSAIF